MADHVDMERVDDIERTFQRVEEEMEDRARREEARENMHGLRITSRSPAPPPVRLAEEPPTVAAAEAENDVQDLPDGATGTMRSVKKRRRGSISISRLGHHQDLAPAIVVVSGGQTLSPPNSPSPYSTIGPHSTSSRGPSPNAVPHNGSNASLASAASSATDRSDHHTTQKQTYAPKKSFTKVIGRVIPRRLTVSRSQNPLGVAPSEVEDVVIGVRVETQEREGADGDAEAEGARVAAGEADGARPTKGLRHMPSTTSSKSSSTRQRWSLISRFAGKLVGR